MAETPVTAPLTRWGINLLFNFDGTAQGGAGDPRQFQVGVLVLW